MSDLSSYSTGELLKEIENRKKQSMPQPKLFHEMDFSKLFSRCVDYVQSVCDSCSTDNYDEELIFIAALETVYGDDIWHNIWLHIWLHIND